MASYVFSDIHGHVQTLKRLFDRLSPAEDDTFFMLGDMVDRGPDSLSVMQFVRDLPNCTTLKGNHEDMMLRALAGDVGFGFDWARNGGSSTFEQIQSLPHDERTELISWVEALPCYAYTCIGEQYYFLVHAGIDVNFGKRADLWDDEACETYLSHQTEDDLMWIREDFWAYPTYLVNDEGKGPIVIAGHTPTLYIEKIAGLEEGSSQDEDGHCVILKLPQVTDETSCIDKIAIDCACAAGAGLGQVALLRLDDMACFYEPIREGE